MNTINFLYHAMHEFWLRHKLSLTLVATLLLFVLSGDLLRKVDVSAAPIDPGILAILPLSAITVISFMMLSHLMIAWQWPVLNQFHLEYLERTFKSLQLWQKCLLYFSFYLAVLSVFVLVTLAYM